MAVRRRVLVVDVGGTHVKLHVTGRRVPTKFDSGPGMTAAAMVAGVKTATAGWKYDMIAMGYPGPVVGGVPVREPFNLGRGWVKFRYAHAFGRPVRIVNDAAMQALGGYRSGRMLFLGLGTGLGSALIVNGELQPLELAHLPYRKERTFEEYIGDAGLKRLGERHWRKHVVDVVNRLQAAMQADSVLLGGGNARLLQKHRAALPKGTRLGSNTDAIRGGMRLWAG